MSKRKTGLKGEVVKGGSSLTINIPLELIQLFGIEYKDEVTFRSVNDQLIIYIEKPP